MKVTDHFNKNRRILIALGFFCLILLDISISNLRSYPDGYSLNKDDNKQENIQNKNINKQDISINNIFSGIGSPWNLTHWANRTFTNLAANFKNDTYDLVELPLGGEWEGYKINGSVKDLYDERNWCNGSFHYGPDDGYPSSPEDDSAFISNQFQNWTFSKKERQTWPASRWFENNYSGNYFSNFEGHDCLELRMNGGPAYGYSTNAFGYDEADKCWWTTTFYIPRGKVVDSELQFDIRANHTMNVNAWSLRFYLNNQRVFDIKTYYLEQEIGSAWTTFKLPQSLWTNQTNIFSNPINGSIIRLNVSIEYTSTSGWWGGFADRQYQQLFLDNIKLIAKAEAKPEQIKLKLNETYVSNSDWGKGSVSLSGKWPMNKIYCNLSSEDNRLLGNYSVELKTDLNLFVINNIPETNYEPNFNSIGTSFSIDNENDSIHWESYAYLSVLNGFKETEMKVLFPYDLNITWISDPQNPNTNKLWQCDNTTAGQLRVPINAISLTPNGYWKIQGDTPNYCQELTVFKNTTINPSGNDWEIANSFLSGDIINFTVRLKDTSLISGYIQQTKAKLHIRFPNGTIWTDQIQFKSPDINGKVNFDYFQIPLAPPNYKAGQYEVIITWNNTYFNYNFNETGIIYEKFIVIHDSILYPDQGQYFIDNVAEEGIFNFKVTFNDKKDNLAIENALIYTNISYIMENFSEISPGSYLYEYNLINAKVGNNTFTIFANSSYYLNQQINLTIYIVKSTLLELEAESLTVPIGKVVNFLVNFTDKNRIHIQSALVQLIGVDLSGNFSENRELNQYSIEIDTNELDIGLRIFTIYAHASDYQSKIATLKLNIRRINAEIKPFEIESRIRIKPGENAEIKIVLNDLDFNKPISDAKVKYESELGEGELQETKEAGVYKIVIENVPEGTYILNISAYAGDDYDIDIYEINLNAIRSKEDILLLQILAISIIIAAICLTGYLIMYQKVLKFPKMIRKIRSFKNNLKNSKKLAKINVLDRESAFRGIFNIKLGKIAAYSKSKDIDKIKDSNKLNSDYNRKDQKREGNFK